MGVVYHAAGVMDLKKSELGVKDGKRLAIEMPRI